jgi:hypothetical protein
MNFRLNLLAMGALLAFANGIQAAQCKAAQCKRVTVTAKPTAAKPKTAPKIVDYSVLARTQPNQIINEILSNPQPKPGVGISSTIAGVLGIAIPAALKTNNFDSGKINAAINLLARAEPFLANGFRKLLNSSVRAKPAAGSSSKSEKDRKDLKDVKDHKEDADADNDSVSSASVSDVPSAAVSGPASASVSVANEKSEKDRKDAKDALDSDNDSVASASASAAPSAAVSGPASASVTVVAERAQHKSGIDEKRSDDKKAASDALQKQIDVAIERRFVDIRNAMDKLNKMSTDSIREMTKRVSDVTKDAGSIGANPTDPGIEAFSYSVHRLAGELEGHSAHLKQWHELNNKRDHKNMLNRAIALLNTLESVLLNGSQPAGDQGAPSACGSAEPESPK